MAESINKILQSLFTTHEHFIERYKSSEIRRITRILKQAEIDLKKEISILSDKMPTEASVAEKKALEKEIVKLQNKYNTDITNTITKQVEELAEYEMQYYADQINKLLGDMKIELTTTVISPEKLNALIAKTPIVFDDGRYYTVSSFLKAFTNSASNIVLQTIRNGLLLNKPIGNISRQLFGLGGRYFKTYNDAATVARTMVNHYANSAREIFYKENTDIVKGYQWLSTLDSRTTDTCRYRDGKTWFYDFPEKSTLPGQVLPPAHMNCRSTTTPIIKSWKELGIEGIEEFPAGTRASLNGYVPEKVTYYEWFNDLDKYVKNPAKVRLEILGPVRYDLWKKNKLNIESFYGREGRLLTLSELSKKDLSISKQYSHYFKGD